MTSNSARLAVVGALSAALLAGGTTGAIAASAAPKPAPSASAKSSLTIKVSPTTVKAGQQVTIVGAAKGLATGSTVQLQHRNGSKWTSLQSSAKVLKGNIYKLTAKLNTKGREVLRVHDGTTTSSPVTVTVR
ncbi:hypothetical protein [Streptantibioticus ferralitis]|uniref:Uncharacterized protein n=1 Tax=Streptantibioticus ferralitis TaxID=236510 RepID=A0ABT5YWY7_9ACTN|nr:hypothetical protein [Streptantibioticus ferralitis]MDF2256121.1 hypothetical protein [Streptantibioticus ferralitis]